MAELEEVAAAPEPPWPDESRLRECIELLVQQADLQTCNVEDSCEQELLLNVALHLLDWKESKTKSMRW